MAQPFRRCTRRECRKRWEPQTTVCPHCGHNRATWGFVQDLPGGGQVRRSGFDTRTAANKEIARIRADLDIGVFVEPSKLTLTRYLEEVWLPHRERLVRLNRLAANTYAQNRNVLRWYVIPRIGHMRMQRIAGAGELNDLYDQLLIDGRRQSNGGLRPKTVQAVHTVLHTALRDAVGRGLLLRNPATDATPPDVPRTQQGRWSPEQLARFLDAAAASRHLPYFVLVAATGMRRGEGLGLFWSDVDFFGGRAVFLRRQLTVVDGRKFWVDTPKGGPAKRRHVPLDELTLEVLRQHRLQQSEDRRVAGPRWVDEGPLVFTKQAGGTYNPNSMYTFFVRLCEEAGLPNIGLHGLRHTYATVALESGVPLKVVSAHLAHSSIAITGDIYTEISDEHAARQNDITARALFGAWRGKKV